MLSKLRGISLREEVAVDFLEFLDRQVSGWAVFQESSIPVTDEHYSYRLGRMWKMKACI